MSRFCARSLTCVRGERVVFARLAFAIDDGDVLVLVGPNGAGKSSLLRLMAGLARPRGGVLAWSGADIQEDLTAHGARVVFVGHADALKPTLSARENLILWARCRADENAPVNVALRALGIEGLADVPARYLSAGQRRRLALARLPLANAALWLLDEPRTALDLHAQTRLDRLMRAHRDAGGIIVLSQHGHELPAGARVLDLGQFGEAPRC